VIVAPLNDRQCLDLVTTKAREWSRSKFAENEAARFRSTAELAESIRAEPQLDDDGKSHGAVTLHCDYNVRVREDPRNPNCVERAAWYLAAAERIDPTLERALITVNVTLDGKRLRHTNVVERPRGTGEWLPVHLEPEPLGPRNSGGDGADIAATVLGVVHPIGKQVIVGLGTVYGGSQGGQTAGQVADALGGYEGQGIQRWRGSDGTTDQRSAPDTAGGAQAQGSLAGSARATPREDVRTAPSSATPRAARADVPTPPLSPTTQRSSSWARTGKKRRTR
jgi:hypothetical protein